MRHIVQLVLAALALAGGVITGLQSRHLVFVAPVADGQPSTTSVAYDPPMMVLTWALITAAGVLAVLGVAGVIRARRARTAAVLSTPVSDLPAPEPS
ncbi:hypothetical protein [Mycobacterium sp. shizuoka-1]|uniref:hypothetical protein n=1 Tax=Mycobacterium sp. shizuoka-1 TaxID=2039281 RepID=UPI000C05CEE9|nr:hypothetical protein [Mycobacterium sp. shizuoka-1]GAY14636.1 hypothetical protein MSZK_13620 [Mycobacterium sp. shizuoka-1]